MSWATSTARRIAAATWIMSSTTVASRAYAVVPAKRSRWSRGGAYRPRALRQQVQRGIERMQAVVTRRAQPRPTTGRIPDFPEQCVGKDGL